MKKLIALLAVAGAFVASNASAQQLINGAGSTFDTPALTKWFSVYQQNHNVHFNYQSIGSGGGIKGLTDETVNFGASDAPMTDAQMSKAPGKILHLPIVCGSVAITYNLPGNPTLKFDPATLSGIYLGEITNWNDPKIAAINPGVNLPDMPIVVVHRSDGSGTTFIFTDYLSTVSPEWKRKVGKNTSVRWPVGLGGKGSEGVSGQIKQLPGAVGYVEQAYADENHLPVGKLKNAAGQFIAPSGEAASKAMATATIPDDFRFSMVNAPGAGAYPIAGASWVILYQHQKNATVGHELVDFLKWAVTKGQQYTPALSYAPLPKNVQQREVQMLDTVTF